MRSWRSSQLEPYTEKYLLEHRFGTTSNSGMIGLLKIEFDNYKASISEKANVKNLNMLTYAYAHRTSLAEMIQNLNCPLLFICGTLSGHRAGTRHMFESVNKAHKSDPKKCGNVELIEIDDTVCPMIEKPEKVVEFFLYFLQGLGIVTSRKQSTSGNEMIDIQRKSVGGTPEKRTCDELVRLDLDTENLPRDMLPKLSSEKNKKFSDAKIVSGNYARYLNRQLSMAELDLPRGPDALSTVKNANLQQSPHRKPQLSSHLYTNSNINTPNKITTQTNTQLWSVTQSPESSCDTNESSDFSAHMCTICPNDAQTTRSSKCVK